MIADAILTVYLSSIFELWLGIPLGFALELNPILIASVSAAGSITAVIGVSLIGDNLRTKFVKWRYKDDHSLKYSRLGKIWNKYGIIGLGLISPLLFGAPLGAAVGIMLGAPRNYLVFWMSVGIILWSVSLTILGITSVETISKMDLL
jgi:hypothetical protein